MKVRSSFSPSLLPTNNGYFTCSPHFISLTDKFPPATSETFLLYSNTIPSQGLGFIDSHASVLDLQLNGRDILIHQSPGVLASTRKGGTTGSGQFHSSRKKKRKEYCTFLV
jgi:hypothetical protein